MQCSTRDICGHGAVYADQLHNADQFAPNEKVKAEVCSISELYEDTNSFLISIMYHWIRFIHDLTKFYYNSHSK